MYITTFVCSKCGCEVQEGRSACSYSPDICGKCQAEEKEQEVQEHLAELRAMTVEQRLERIERWIYEHKCDSSDPVFGYGLDG